MSKRTNLMEPDANWEVDAPTFPARAETSSQVCEFDPPIEGDEVLIADVRADLTPAQMVERKLNSMLKDNLVPVSLMCMTRNTMRRGPK